jgi:hypothetical protein
MREKGNPEPDLIPQIAEDLFQPYGHNYIIQKIAQAREDKKEPVQVQKDLARLDIIDRSQEKEDNNYCNGCLDNPEGILF